MTCSGQKVFNVIGIHMPGPYVVPDVLTAVKTAWEATLGPLKTRPNTLTMVGYHGVDLSSSTGSVGFLGSNTSGGQSGDVSLLSAAGLIKISSGTRARRANGRLFHGPLVESQINADGRTLSGTWPADLTTAYTNFKTAMTTANMPWVIISRKYSSTADVTSVGVRSVVSSQDRRLRS
jgi:hypothetical protein